MSSARTLVLTTAPPVDRFGVARRGAAAVLVTAVLLGSGGVTLAVSTLVPDAWTVGLVVLTAVLAGALLAANGWRKSMAR